MKSQLIISMFVVTPVQGCVPHHRCKQSMMFHLHTPAQSPVWHNSLEKVMAAKMQYTCQAQSCGLINLLPLPHCNLWVTGSDRSVCPLVLMEFILDTADSDLLQQSLRPGT